MRYLAWFGAILAILTAVIYVAVFTSFGNNLIRPIVENRIKEKTKLDSKLTTFLLRVNTFEIVLELDKNNFIKAKGDYSLFLQSFDFIYSVDFENLQSFEPLVKIPLNGTFRTDGTVNGDISFTKIDGKSDVGESDTSYHIELNDLKPTSIIAKMKDAKLSALLYLGAKNPYAAAEIDLDVNFKNITPQLMDGYMALKSKNGNIDSKYMKSDYNVTVPDTPFEMNFDAKLKGDSVDYSYSFLSELLKVTTFGRVAPEHFKADANFSINAKNIEVLKPITALDIRGPLKISGDINGTKENLVVKGGSDLALPDAVFEAVLKDFSTQSLKVKVENLQIAKLLYLLNEPHYADGILSMNADISNMQGDKANGKIFTTITNGLLDSKYLGKKYDFKSKMPATAFSATAATDLNGDIADTKVDFNSNIANIDIKRATYNMKDGSISSDYVAQIADLEKLFFVTQRHMRGGATINGEFLKRDDLDMTFHANIAGGKVDAKLHNDDFFADINSANTKKLLYMLDYNELFDATLNAKINYNLEEKKGTFDGRLLNCMFAKNQTFELIKQYVKFDMYRENFNGNINAKINKENISASLDLRSKDASIKSASTKLNTKAKIIDSDITIFAKKDSISANLSGDADAPKIRVDLEKFLNSQTGEKVMKNIDKLFKKLF